jgi:heptosyltransferase-1
VAERILLVRLGALGDIIHAIPVAAALRRAFPAARIDWLVAAKHREILDLVPVIDRRLVWSGTVFRAMDSSGRGNLSPALAGIRELRRSRYDVAIDMQGLLKSAIIARASGARRVVGFASTYLRERLARPFYTDAFDPGCGDIYDPRETRHVVQINLGLLEPLGLTVVRPEFPIDRVDSEIARRIADRTAGRYAILNPGAAWPNKRWPPPRFGAVAAALHARHGLASVVTWGPGEQSIAQETVSASSGAAMLTPPTSVGDLVALARGASLMISGDTGPTHIATALGTPIVGIYGPTRPSRNGPWSPADAVVSRDATCECLHLRRCKRQTMCLMDIEVEEVLTAVERRLAAEPTRV